MLYVRNVSRQAEWIEDPQSGFQQRVEPNALARVTDAHGIHLVDTKPQVWALAPAIALPPPEPESTS